MKTCDVCQKSLGMFNKFRYADGYICKDCYEKASHHFTQTIAQKNLQEVKELCENGTMQIDQDFVITGRIGNYLLVDEKNQKICILNHRMLQKDKKVTNPEFYEIKDITGVTMKTNLDISADELEKKVLKMDDDLVSKLKITIYFANKKQEKDIYLLENPVRIKSYAFRKSYQFAKRITEEINRLARG